MNRKEAIIKIKNSLYDVKEALSFLNNVAVKHEIFTAEVPLGMARVVNPEVKELPKVSQILDISIMCDEIIAKLIEEELKE